MLIKWGSESPQALGLNNNGLQKQTNKQKSKTSDKNKIIKSWGKKWKATLRYK